MLKGLRSNLLWVVLAIGFAIRFVIALLLPPGFDEAYYFLYTLNPDWSYFDHPPLVAGTTELGISLLGDVTPLSIRFGTLLIYTLTLYLLYRAGKQLFSEKVGLLALIIATIAPIFQVAFGAMTLPDAPLMLFWLLSLNVAIAEFFPRSDRAYRPTRKLAILGFCVGLACLGKYHGFVLGAGILGFVLSSPKHWRALYSPWTIASVVLFVMALAPMLYWNHLHDWASFTFQAERGVPAKQFEWDGLGRALLREMLFLFPTIGIPLLLTTLIAIAQQLRSGFTKDDLVLKRRLVLWVSAPVMIGFTLIGGYRQIFPTWAMPGFFTATLLLAEVAQRWRWWKGVLVATAILVHLLMAIALSHVVWGTFQTPSQNQIYGLIPANVRDDGSIELIDIQQLRRGIQAQPQLLAAVQNTDFIFTNRFHLSGHVGMATTPLARKPITCFDRRDMRGFAFWSSAEQWVGQTGLYFTTDSFQTEEDSAAEYRPYFQRFEKLGEVPLLRGGVIVDRIHVFRGEKLLKPFPRPIKATQGA